MNQELHSFTKSLEALSKQDMYAISENLNTIEPSVGEVSRILPFLENLTFLDYVSAAFVITLIVFSFMPKIKKTKAWNSIRSATSR